jgi:uncharacterized cupin superfamily protein
MSQIKKHKPSQDELDKLGVTGWGVWSCETSTFDWHYDSSETFYVLEGEVTVKTGQEELRIEPGDLVTMPQGLDCTWQVASPIRKHYKFD